MAGAFPVSGQIDPQSFPFLLVELHHNGATGSLKVEGPSYQKALYFRGGRILFGSSNDPRDQLGAILIETGTLTPEQLEEANSKVGPGSPLAKVLSETGFVTQRELGEAARAKVERILSDVIAYTAGNFEFEDGVLPKGAVDLKLSTERVLLAAVRRVTDRGFVLRHLEGLDVVLTPVAEMRGKLPEVEAEASELLARLDGRTTLKDAAAGTRLDEFDAAKLACTLVFLGILRRAQDGAAAAQPHVPFTLPDQPAEIDLLATARDALAATAPAPVAPAATVAPAFEPPAPPFEPPMPPPDEFRLATAPEPFMTSPSADQPEMSIFVPDDVRPVGPPPPVAPPAAEPDPIFSPDPEPPSVAASSFEPPVEEVPIVSPSAPRQAVPDTAPYIPSRTPELSIPAAPAGVGPSKREAREWKPPARSTATPPPARPEHSADLEIEPGKQSASRPSKDDLAALDALLNAKGLEGPLQPLERPASDRWSPQFAGGRDRTGAAPRAAAPPGRARAALVAIGLAVAATAAFWYYFGRPQQGASASSPSSLAPAPTPSPENAQASPPAASSDGASAPAIGTATSSAATTAPRPTPAPVVAAATPLPRASAPAGPGGLREARTLLSSGNLPAAARGFAAHLKAAPAGTSTVQLLVACSADTVQKAVRSVSSPELYIVPVKYQGRDCYRLCWGLYAGADQAATAARALPDYFRKGGATPRVMSAAELLP